VLDEAIRETRAGIDAAGDDLTRAVHLNNLGGYLYQLFLVTGDLPALRDADQVIRQVLALVAAERPERPMLLDNHRRVLVKLFNRTGDTAKLAEAVASAHESVMTGLTGEAGRATSLAVVLPAVLGRQGDGTALAEMIELADGPAGQDADDDAAYRGQTLFLACVALKVTEWADESNDTALLQQALEASRDAASAIPAGHPHRGLALNDVGLAASFLGDQTGDLALFAEWVQAARERVSIAVDDPDRAAALDSLGEALRKSAERTGDTGMLDEAVRTARAAVDLAPPGPDRARYVDNLRKALSTLGERTGDAAVLGEAGRAARETASLAGPADPDQAEYLANLSSALRQLSERTPDAAGVLAEAVHAARRAVAAASADDRYRGYYLNGWEPHC
jgi:tetratricopeptide (TPR) repeat protein